MPSGSSSRTWATKGVSDRTREAVLEAPYAAGLMVGEWVDQIPAERDGESSWRAAQNRAA
jgi:hypothetical protein